MIPELETNVVHRATKVEVKRAIAFVHFSASTFLEPYLQIISAVVQILQDFVAILDKFAINLVLI
jgi:hypothetical protein